MSKARATTVLFILMLAAAQAAAGRQAGAGSPYRLALPDKDWALDFTLPPRAGEGADAPGPKPAQDAPRLASEPIELLSDDGRENRLFFFLDMGKKRHPSDSRVVYVTLSPARAAGGAEGFRNFVLRGASSGGPLEGVKTSEYKRIPVARYRLALEPLLQLPPSQPLAMRHGARRSVQAFLARDDVWVSVVVSGQDAGGREEALLHSLLDSLKFTDTSAPATSFDFYHKGRLLYMRNDYRRAAEALGAGLELEKRERRLDRASWRALVINLVDSYAASRELARAKEVLDFGVAEDPTNAVFHIALARYHAMRNDLDNAIASLEKAYVYKDERSRAAVPFNPLRDPAFERFSKDERFLKAVKALKK